MSLLAVGLSHNTAPVDLLERATVDRDRSAKLLADLLGDEVVAEAAVLATCNRVEIYAEVGRFHGGVQRLTESLGRASGVSAAELAEHLYVHYEDKAVEHLFSVAAGLDSMVVGEQQILGQIRASLALGREESAVGRLLGPLMERALRVGKRVQSDTGLGAAGRSLVSVGVEVAAAAGLAAGWDGGIAGRPVAVLGAGSISSLAAHTLHRAGAGSITVLNRTAARAARLATAVDGTWLPVTELVAAMTGADLLVSCTGATGTVVTAVDVAAALRARNGRPVVILDLALPRDVDPAVRGLTGVTVVGLDELSATLVDGDVGAEVQAARALVADEVGSWLARQRADRVAPAVVALRTRAGKVVDAELARLLGRLPDLDERTVAEIRQTLARTVDKLLHTPTVRIKELAEAPGGDTYAEALRDLFALDPQATEAVARASLRVDEDGE